MLRTCNSPNCRPSSTTSAPAIYPVPLCFQSFVYKTLIEDVSDSRCLVQGQHPGPAGLCLLGWGGETARILGGIWGPETVGLGWKVGVGRGDWIAFKGKHQGYPLCLQ